jgi:hypothetical protein
MEAPKKEFTIPLDLIKSFQTDVRWVPVTHHNGYIRFDSSMLQKILLSDNAADRKQLAAQLKELNVRGGQLVIVAEEAI